MFEMHLTEMTIGFGDKARAYKQSPNSKSEQPTKRSSNPDFQ